MLRCESRREDRCDRARETGRCRGRVEDGSCRSIAAWSSVSQRARLDAELVDEGRARARETPRAPPPVGPSGRAPSSEAPRVRSRSGCSATSRSSSPTTSAWRPRARSASIRRSRASSRSSSRRPATGRGAARPRGPRAPARATARAPRGGRSTRSSGSPRSSARLPSRASSLEPLEIERSHRDAEDVRRRPASRSPPCRAPCEDPRRSPARGSPARAGWAVSPQAVDEVRGRDERVRAADEKREHRALLRRPESRLAAVHVTSSGPSTRYSTGIGRHYSRPVAPSTLPSGTRSATVAACAACPSLSSIPLPGLALRLLLLPR